MSLQKAAEIFGIDVSEALALYDAGELSFCERCGEPTLFCDVFFVEEKGTAYRTCRTCAHVEHNTVIIEAEVSRIMEHFDATLELILGKK